MTFSYTQISQYLRCPRAYRYRYLDGWREKDNRASLLFGRCFEKALAAFFAGEDSAAALFKEWGAYQEAQVEYSKGDNWERMLRQGVQLLDRLAQDDRVQIGQPRQNMQVKLIQSLSAGNDFVAYVDAIGTLDGKPSLLEWKTTTARYPEEPEGLLALDPQLTCYSWISGISDVAVVTFVRKRFSEIQYLKTTISDQQRRDFGQLVGATVSQIEAGQFAPHSGIRFPQNGCLSCSQLGYLCEVRAGQYWRLDNLKSFDEFLERKFPESRRKAYYLMAIHERLPRIAKPDLKLVGWSKAIELAKVARRDRQSFDCATWLHKAKALPKEEFKREVDRHLTGRETEPWEILYFKVYKSQLPVIEQALETAGLMLGTGKSRSYCLEMICADFLAGASLETGNQDARLSALTRLILGLQKPLREQLIESVQDVP